MIELKATDRVAFDLHMYQVDYNEQKIEQLKHDISDKYGLPLKNITINFIPITNILDIDIRAQFSLHYSSFEIDGRYKGGLVEVLSLSAGVHFGAPKRSGR